MTVLWQAEGSGRWSLAWGRDETYSLGGASVVPNEHRQYSLTIPGLPPGEVIHYRVSKGETTVQGSFRAAPPEDAENVVFFAYGDTRKNTDRHDALCQRMLEDVENDPALQSLVIHVGDWVTQSKKEESWRKEYFTRRHPKTLEFQSKMPVMGCRGNHDSKSDLFAKYLPFPYVADHYYSFDYGPVHFAVLDQYSDYRPGSAQMNWLEEDLAATGKRWKIVVLHEPGWSAGGGHMNNKDVQTRIQPLCKKHGVDVVLTGHNHYYARCEVDGVQHVTTGAGGAELHKPKADMPHVVKALSVDQYCRFGVRGNTLRFEAFDSKGAVIDEFSIER